MEKYYIVGLGDGPLVVVEEEFNDYESAFEYYNERTKDLPKEANPVVLGRCERDGDSASCSAILEYKANN